MILVALLVLAAAATCGGCCVALDFPCAHQLIHCVDDELLSDGVRETARESME